MNFGLSRSDCIAMFSGLSGSVCISIFSGGAFYTGIGCLAVGVLFVEFARSASVELFDFDCIAVFSGGFFSTGVGCFCNWSSVC